MFGFKAPELTGRAAVPRNENLRRVRKTARSPGRLREPSPVRPVFAAVLPGRDAARPFETRAQVLDMPEACAVGDLVRPGASLVEIDG